MFYLHYLMFCTVIHIAENKSIDDSLTIIYFTTNVSKYQERSLFSIQLVSFWNFQKHASTDQMDPSGIHNLFGRSTINWQQCSCPWIPAHMPSCRWARRTLLPRSWGAGLPKRYDLTKQGSSWTVQPIRELHKSPILTHLDYLDE